MACSSIKFQALFVYVPLLNCWHKRCNFILEIGCSPGNEPMQLAHFLPCHISSGLAVCRKLIGGMEGRAGGRGEAEIDTRRTSPLTQAARRSVIKTGVVFWFCNYLHGSLKKVESPLFSLYGRKKVELVLLLVRNLGCPSGLQSDFYYPYCWATFVQVAQSSPVLGQHIHMDP